MVRPEINLIKISPLNCFQLLVRRSVGDLEKHTGHMQVYGHKLPSNGILDMTVIKMYKAL